jgi:hypothetical protein
LLLAGQDPFVVEAGKHGLLYEEITEKGWPIQARVGRHCSTILQLAATWSEMYLDQAVTIEDVPRYADLMKNGVGRYLRDPSKAAKDRIAYE